MKMKKNPYTRAAVKEFGFPREDGKVSLAEQYAQMGEDVVIAGLLKSYMFGKTGEDISNLAYLELGAHHPITLSSTYLLYRKYGMRGVLVDANINMIDALQKARPEDTILQVAVTHEDKEEVTLILPDSEALATIRPNFLEAWPYSGADNQRHIPVKACRINDILTQHFSDAAPAYMSVDIEGYDLEILADMDFEKCRPLIIQVEYSNHFISDYDKRICAFMQSKNYHLIAVVSVNLIFVSDDFFQTLPPPHIGQGKVSLSTPQYFTKKYKKKSRQHILKSAIDFIKSYLIFPWYTYKTYKKVSKIENKIR